MAGEIQLNSTTMATESSGSITAELDTIRPNATNGSLTLQGDSSDAGVTGLTIDSSGNATFAQSILGGTIGSGVTFPALGNSAVGTVSESSGIPTGDIMERGSNANGEFVKFADGTMICTMSDTRSIDTNDNAVLSGGRYLLGTDLSFPSTFDSAPVVSSSSSDSATWANARNETTTTYRYAVYSNTGSDRGSVTIKTTAIGRWF